MSVNNRGKQRRAYNNNPRQGNRGATPTYAEKGQAAQVEEKRKSSRLLARHTHVQQLILSQDKFRRTENVGELIERHYYTSHKDTGMDECRVIGIDVSVLFSPNMGSQQPSKVWVTGNPWKALVEDCVLPDRVFKGGAQQRTRARLRGTEWEPWDPEKYGFILVTMEHRSRPWMGEMNLDMTIDYEVTERREGPRNRTNLGVPLPKGSQGVLQMLRDGAKGTMIESLFLPGSNNWTVSVTNEDCVHVGCQCLIKTYGQLNVGMHIDGSGGKVLAQVKEILGVMKERFLYWEGSLHNVSKEDRQAGWKQVIPYLRMWKVEVFDALFPEEGEKEFCLIWHPVECTMVCDQHNLRCVSRIDRDPRVEFCAKSRTRAAQMIELLVWTQKTWEYENGYARLRKGVRALTDLCREQVHVSYVIVCFRWPDRGIKDGKMEWVMFERPARMMDLTECAECTGAVAPRRILSVAELSELRGWSYQILSADRLVEFEMYEAMFFGTCGHHQRTRKVYVI